MRICRYDRDAKYTMHPYDGETLYGIRAMMVVERYCRIIAIAKFKGFIQHKLQYCFAEWIEGKTLNDEVLGSPANASVGNTRKDCQFTGRVGLQSHDMSNSEIIIID